MRRRKHFLLFVKYLPILAVLFLCADGLILLLNPLTRTAAAMDESRRAWAQEGPVYKAALTEILANIAARTQTQPFHGEGTISLKPTDFGFDWGPFQTITYEHFDNGSFSVSFCSTFYRDDLYLYVYVSPDCPKDPLADETPIGASVPFAADIVRVYPLENGWFLVHRHNTDTKLYGGQERRW